MRFRVNRMVSRNFVRFHANIYHTNLGLKKVAVLAEATQGYEDLLFNCLKANSFWLYLCRCYGRFEGCHAVYAIPKEHTAEFEDFIGQIVELGVAQDIKLFWSTCFHDVPITCKWFDPESESWTFQWDKWIEEIPRMETKLPYTLIDPDDFVNLADEVDIFILVKLEKDATISFKKLAEMLGMTPQGVKYHFQEHIIKRGLIEGFQVTFLPFDPPISDMFFFTFNFADRERMAKFAQSLLDKPFVLVLGKILTQNRLLAYLYLPRKEFRRFVDSLSKLIRNRLLESYQYVIIDMEKTLRQTILHEAFKERSWIYNHEKFMSRLKELVESADLR